MIMGLTSFCLFMVLQMTYGQSDREIGLPVITNFHPRDYKGNSQTWSVEQDERGMIYVGCTGGLLEFDGVKWRQVPIPDNPSGVSIRSMAKDKDGVIYLGNFGFIGRIAPDSLGNSRIESLTEFLPEDKRDFFDIWSIHRSPTGMYFQSREYIFHLAYPDADGKRAVKVWQPETKFMYAFLHGDEFFVHQQGLGLFKMVGEKFEFVPGSEFLGKERMQIMMPFSTDENGKIKEYLIGMFAGGLHIYNGQSFRPLISDADPLIKSGPLLYKGIRLRNGHFALCTAGNGLIILDSKGQLVRQINGQTGLQDESVYGLAQDRNGMIWLALDNGVARVETASPVTRFSKEAGIQGQILRMKRFQGDLFLGMTSYMLRYNEKNRSFDRVEGLPPSQVFSFYNFRDEEIIVPGDGLHSYDGKRVRQIRNSVSGDFQTTDVRVLAQNPDILVSVGQVGVAIFNRRPGQGRQGSNWVYQGIVPGIREELWDLYENNDGTLWVGTQAGKVFRIKLAFDQKGMVDLDQCTVDTYDGSNGLENAPGRIVKIKNKIYAGGDKVLYVFDDSQNKFIPTDIFGSVPSLGFAEQFDLQESPDGRVWITLSDKGIRLATPQPDGTYILNDSLLNQLSGEIISSHLPEENGVVWIGTTDGLLRFDSRLAGLEGQNFKTFFRHITAGKNPLPHAWGKADEIFKAPSIQFRDNTLRFEFAAPFLLQDEKTMYQTWLEGFETDWSDWDLNHYKEYTNLPQGKYKFHVRARNFYNHQSEEAIYPFTILAPWYATWLAYLLYALLAAAAVFALVRWRTRQLHQKHKELEVLVDARTHELSHRVSELAVINSVQESLVSEMEMQGIYELVGEKLREIFKVDVIDIVTYDPSTGLIEDKYAYEKGDRTMLGPRQPRGFRKHVIDSKDVLVLNEGIEAKAREFDNEVLIGEMPKSGVMVPMISGGKVTGIISLQDMEKEHSFPASSVSLISTLANSMSVALESARRYEETKKLLKETEQRNAELAVINSVQDGLVREMDINGIYVLIGEKIREIFDAQVIDIVSYDRQKDLIEDKYAYEKGDLTLLGAREPRGFRKHIIHSGETMVINADWEHVARQYGNDVLIGEQPKSMVLVPLISSGQVSGIISLQNLDHDHAFSDSDIRLINTLANSMSMALESARLFDETKRLLRETEQRTAELA
ncbi:MAG TPA: GAF domain-containing protein, partial [Phnomibacter sp.]|nr:GAF domain-containing protein [Phnomibacter sp.]